MSKAKYLCSVTVLSWLALAGLASAQVTVRQLTVTVSDAGQIAQDSSGWTDDGTTVRLTTPTDNVGIGLATVAAKLHLSQGATYTPGAGIKMTTDNTGILLADGFNLHFDSSNNLYFANYETGYTRFDIDGTGRMTLSTTGLIVGSPTGGAQGHGTLNATGLYINGVPITISGWTDTGTLVKLATAGDSVGIGLAAVEAKLHVSGKTFVDGFVRKDDYVDLYSAAWLGAVDDTISSIIPCKALRHNVGDTAYIDYNLPDHAVRIDSAWAIITTTLTTADSVRLKLAYRLVDFGDTYTGSFTSQNSDYVDLGAIANLKTKVRFTTSIDVAENPTTQRLTLILRLTRDNTIDNNSAGRVKFDRLWLFGRGLK